MAQVKHKVKSMENKIRLLFLQAGVGLSILFLVLGFVFSYHFWWLLIVFMPLAFLGFPLTLSCAPCRSAAGCAYLREMADKLRHTDAGENQKVRRRK